jgi:signal transduction histidine kinase
VDVVFRLEDRTLGVTVADDGSGFDPSAPREGRGLENMRARAAALGGTLDVAAAPGNGTRLVLSGVKLP